LPACVTKTVPGFAVCRGAGCRANKTRLMLSVRVAAWAGAGKQNFIFARPAALYMPQSAMNSEGGLNEVVV
jgi:hypothetical protein